MKINKLTIGLLLAGVVLAYYLFGPVSSVNNSGVNKQLVIGVAAGYAPFVSINPAGEYEGFDIDVARALAQEMDQELVLRDLGSMTSLFTALNQGQIDLIIWGLSITSARLEKVEMVHYYGESLTSYPLIFWQEIPVGVSSLADLTGETVCIEPGSAQEAVLDQFDLINKLPVEKIDDALLNIQYGKAVAALVEPAIAKKFQAKYPQVKILSISLAPQAQEQGLGIVIRPDQVGLINQVQQAVQKLKNRDVINQLAQKWSLEL